MSVTTFMYITNIFINMCYVYPLVIFLTILYFFIKLLYIGSFGNELERLSFFNMVNKFIFISMISILSFSFIPSRELVLFEAESIGCKIFDGNQEDKMMFYDFMDRIK